MKSLWWWMFSIQYVVINYLSVGCWVIIEIEPETALNDETCLLYFVGIIAFTNCMHPIGDDDWHWELESSWAGMSSRLSLLPLQVVNDHWSLWLLVLQQCWCHQLYWWQWPSWQSHPKSILQERKKSTWSNMQSYLGLVSLSSVCGQSTGLPHPSLSWFVLYHTSSNCKNCNPFCHVILAMTWMDLPHANAR